MRSKHRAFQRQQHRFDQRVCVDRASLQRANLGARRSKNALPRLLRWSRGAVVGAVRLHERLPPCRTFVGAGVWGLKKHYAGLAPDRLNELGSQGWEAVGLTSRRATCHVAGGPAQAVRPPGRPGRRRDHGRLRGPGPEAAPGPRCTAPAGRCRRPRPRSSPTVVTPRRERCPLRSMPSAPGPRHAAVS